MLREFHGHTEAVTAISWMPDGRQFLSGGYGKKVFVWRTDASEPTATWHGERVRSKFHAWGMHAVQSGVVDVRARLSVVSTI